MLTAPELTKDFNDFVEQQFKYKLENGLLPDISKIDLPALEKQNRKMNIGLIKGLIQKCPIHSDFEKKNNNEIIQAYFSDFLNENFPPMHPKTTMNIIGSINQNATINSMHPPLNKFLLFIEVSKLFYFFVQENYLRKVKDMPQDLFLNHEFLTYSFDLIDGIDALLLAGKNNSVISIYRTFYENYIVFSYLQIHPELKTAFIEHKDMLHCSIIKEEYSVKNLEIDESVKTRIDELEKKYGTAFKDNYGWTASVIEERTKRNLKTMFEELNLSDVFAYYYKLACNFTHATSFSLLCRPKIDNIYGYIYAIVEIFIREFDVLLGNIKMITKEKALIREWLFYMARDVNKALNEWYHIT